MWDKLFDGLKNILTISVKVERHEKEIADLKTEVKNLTLQVSFLLSELRHATEQRDADRREIGLFIENQFLKLERRLPSGKETKNDEE